MIVDRIFIVLCLVTGIICQGKSTTSGEVVSEGTLANDDNSVSNNEVSTDKSTNTDIDTYGDIIITSEPELDENETEDDSIHGTANVTENILVTTTIILPTTTDNVTLPDEIHVSPCSSSPCKNGGVCYEDPFSHVLYNCDCANNYTGTHCQVADQCTIDDKGNVCNKGACVYSNDGLTRSCKCFFGMFWNEVEGECRDIQPPCLPNPCLNGGTCMSHEGVNFRCACKSGYEGLTCDIPNWCIEGDICENGKCILDKDRGMKLCKCNKGFYFNKETWECDHVEPPCIPSPCKNNGICEPVVNDTGNFNCTCSQGFVGPTCEIKDMCTISANGQVCENGICENSKDTRKCNCNEEFYLNENTQTCNEIQSPCTPNPCSHDGICVPLSHDHYNCSCSDGYGGRHCTDLDYCVLNGGNGFCGEAECWNDPQLKMFYCACEIHQYFDYTSRTCVAVDFCPLMKCGENEICEKSICKCDEDFEQNNSSGKCEPQLCSFDSCPVKDLVCSQDAGALEYRCSCEKGSAFNGTHCNGGADCVFPSLNSCSQICKISENRTVCSCAEGYFEMSEDNRTCSPLSSNITCEKKTCFKGICVVTPDSEEMCICPPGYTEVEGNCVDLCSADLLPEGYCPNNHCEPTSNGFRCKCDGKYTLSDDRTTCTVRQVCEMDEVGWFFCAAHNAECVEDWNTEEGFRCECSDGQMRTENGDCHDVCSDAENQKICSNFKAECDSYKGEVSCRCPPYFQPYQNGTVCNKPASTSYILTLPLNYEAYRKVKQINARQRRSVDTVYEVDVGKAQKDVTSTLNTMFPGLLQSNIVVCRENKNFILCKVEMQFSSVLSVDLKRLKLSDNCLTIKDSISKCLLPPSLILQRMFVDNIVSYKKTDPCDTDIKEVLCGSDTLCTSSLSTHSFNCTCKDGFEARSKQFPFGDTESYIESCRDVDECLNRNACPQHMYCKNTIGSYMCSCKARYMFKDTANPNGGCVEICNPNPCLHGQCSSVGDHDFECRCDAGYSGLLCNLRDENFKRAWTNTVVVGAVLGGALLVTLILSIVYTSRLKKRKYSDGPEHMLYATEMTERRNVDSGTINNAFQK